jgi:hypothetical protein
MDVESERGTEREASEALSERRVAAVVYLNEARASIWVSPEDQTSEQAEPVHIERGDGESSEMFALRSAELLRGKLLPGKSDSATSGRQKKPATTISRTDRSLSFTLGPALMLQSYAVVAPGMTGDIAAWLGRFGAGPYFTMPLVRNNWTGAKELTFTQYSLGLGGRFLAYKTRDKSFELQVLLRVGMTRHALEQNKGPEAERLIGVANHLTVEPGVEGSFAITSWLRVGGQTLAWLDIPLTQPVSEGALPPPAKGKGKGKT